MQSNVFKCSVLTLLIIALSACSTLPEDLVSTNPNVQTSYSNWKKSLDVSQEVRLGGVIAHVTNLKYTTRVEVVNLPIASNGKPDINQEPQGRFVAYVQGLC